jgi:hypothetical protein
MVWEDTTGIFMVQVCEVLGLYPHSSEAEVQL